MSVLSHEIQEGLHQVRSLLERGIVLTRQGRFAEEAERLEERLKQFESAALFVVVGEVKAGKSSFINALLKEDVCEVAAAPCTAQIQELVYADTARREAIGDHWERVYLPSEVLREVSIVDTPGTNSIIENHQTITERYIPQSDLVIFVFPAKNPHTNTAWELLSFIRAEWHRKIVFVLQQSDLTTNEELRENTESVKQYARQRNVQNPVVFAVSAKREEQGDMGSGYAEFRRYLQQAVEQGEVWKLKINGARQTVRTTAETLLAQLSARRDALEKDREFLHSLSEMIDSRHAEVGQFTDLIVSALSRSYELLVEHLKRDFAEGLKVGNVLRRSIPFLRDQSVTEWLKTLEQRFQVRVSGQINAEAEKASKELTGKIDDLFHDLKQRIELHQSRIIESEGQAPDRIEIFHSLNQKLDDIRLGDLFSDQAGGTSDVVNLALAGGGIAALGAVITVYAKAIIFDITGGVLAAAGALVIAATLIWKRRAITADFERKIDRSCEEFRTRLDDEIRQICEKIFIELRHRVETSAKPLQKQMVALSPQIEAFQSLLEETSPR